MKLPENQIIVIFGASGDLTRRKLIPALNAWKTNPAIPVYGYPAGYWGPDVADQLIIDGLWRYPCKNVNLLYFSCSS